MDKNNFFQSHNFSKSSKIIFVLALFVLSFGVFEIFENIFATHNTITKTFTSGIDKMISFRDIGNTDPTVRSISVDPDTTIELTITVIDDSADIDTGTLDVVFSSATSTTSGAAAATATLTETGVNTGEFTGTIILSSTSTTSGNVLQANSGDQFGVTYIPHPFDEITETTGNPNRILELARVDATVDLTTGGDITITDVITNFNPSEFQLNNGIRPVLYPVDISFSNGATQVTSTDMVVTISFANANLKGQPNNSTLQMYYKPVGGGWNLIRDQFFPQGFDNDVATITSAPTQAGFGADVTEGQFLLGFDVGFGGGGGGGLVRAGLVVNALAGAVAGGGGGGPPGPTVTLGALALYDSAVEIISMPQEIRDIVLNHDPNIPLEPITDIYEDFDLPLSINGNGFALGGYENTLETQTIKPGEPTEFNIVFYTNSEIAHTSLYFNLGPTRTIAGSDTQVLLYKDKPVEIIDPNGNIASVTGSINNEGDLKRVVTFSITFSESAELPNHDIVIRSWTDNLSSGDTIIYDAIEIAQPVIVEIADEDLPEPEIQTLKSQHVPIWIKNNAAWWSQELIEDSDFVAGIEYLIQQEIITLTESRTLETNSSDEIPNWIKNNASWWSEDLITEKEFIDGLQWLISNGIIQVTET